MSQSVVAVEIENVMGFKPNMEAVETITWFKNNNPYMELKQIIEDYYL